MALLTVEVGAHEAIYWAAQTRRFTSTGLCGVGNLWLEHAERQQSTFNPLPPPVCLQKLGAIRTPFR